MCFIPGVGDCNCPCDESEVYQGSEDLVQYPKAAFWECVSKVKVENQECCKVPHVLAMGRGKAVTVAHTT